VNDIREKRTLALNGHKDSVTRMLYVLERSHTMIEELEIAERQHYLELSSQLDRLCGATTASTPTGEQPSRQEQSHNENRTTPSLDSFWSSFEYRGLQQRFFVCRLGSTGSAYLAKLIGAHPEVYCSHEGILANRPFSAVRQTEEEQQAFLTYLCADAMHHAYKATGDVGSAWLAYLRLAPKYCPVGNAGPLLRTGILHRHPLRVLKTQLHIAAREPVSLPTDATKIMSEYFGTNGIDCDLKSVNDSANRNFIWTCYQWRECAIHGGSLDVQIHVERLNDLNYAQEKLCALTGVEYSATLLSPLIGKVVNTRTGEVEPIDAIYANLPQSYQHWYRVIVDDVADSIGYSR